MRAHRDIPILIEALHLLELNVYYWVHEHNAFRGKWGEGRTKEVEEGRERREEDGPPLSYPSCAPDARSPEPFITTKELLITTD